MSRTKNVTPGYDHLHQLLCFWCAERERDEARAALATLQADNAELRERLEAAEAAKERAIEMAAVTHGHNVKLKARATAAEGERDRLRELLERARVEFKRIAELARVSGWPVMAAIAEKAATRAIPHTEGEASAPPKERCRVPMEPTDLDRGLCQRGKNHEGGHCLYDIDAAVAGSAPPKETTR